MNFDVLLDDSNLLVGITIENIEQMTYRVGRAVTCLVTDRWVARSNTVCGISNVHLIVRMPLGPV